MPGWAAAITAAGMIASSAISSSASKGGGGGGGGSGAGTGPLAFAEFSAAPGTSAVGRQYTNRVMNYLGTGGAPVTPREIAPFEAGGIFGNVSGLSENYDPTDTALGKRVGDVAGTSTVMPAAQTAMVDTLGRQGVFDPYDPITQSQIQATTRPIFTQRDADLSLLKSQAEKAGQGAGFGSRYGLGAADIMTGANLGAADVTANILGAERSRIEKMEQDYRLGALGLAPELEEARYLGPKYDADAARVDILRRSQQTEASRVAAGIAEQKRAVEQAELDRVFDAERITEARDLARQDSFNRAIQAMLSGPRGSGGSRGYGGGGHPMGQTIGNVSDAAAKAWLASRGMSETDPLPADFNNSVGQASP